MVTWGAGDYGQLGNGDCWDDPRPRVVMGIRDVVKISAGLRHNIVLRCGKDSACNEVWAWGHNGYGELGLGDKDIRLQPTRVTALDRARVLDVSCGDRHSLFVTDHRPLVMKDDPALKEYFHLLQVRCGV